MFNLKSFLAAPAIAGLMLAVAPMIASADDGNSFTFPMVVNAGAKTCLPNARAIVHIQNAGPVEIMDIGVDGLPPNTDFDFFVIQVPKGPFGVACYQGDIETDKQGRASGHFVGRFSIETFAV